MTLTKSELQDLKGMLAASGSLPSCQEDLIDDAIFSVQNGSEYRAQQALKTMMRNYQNEGNSEAARLVDRVL